MKIQQIQKSSTYKKLQSCNDTIYLRPRFHEREVFPSHREVVMIQNNGKNRFSNADDDLFNDDLYYDNHDDKNGNEE